MVLDIKTIPGFLSEGHEDADLYMERSLLGFGPLVSVNVVYRTEITAVNSHLYAVARIIHVRKILIFTGELSMWNLQGLRFFFDA